MNAAIVPIETKAVKKMKPPVSKKELIEALAKREEAKLTLQYEAATEKVKSAAKALDSFIERIRAEGVVDVGYGGTAVIHDRWASGAISVGITLRLSPVPPEIKRAVDALDKARKEVPMVPPLREIQRQIADRLKEKTESSERVNAMLADPATLKALDAMLKAMHGKEGES